MYFNGTGIWGGETISLTNRPIVEREDTSAPRMTISPSMMDLRPNKVTIN